MTAKTEPALLVDLLAAARRDGACISDLPRNLIPATLDEAYETGRLLVERLDGLCGPVAGYKVGATNPQGQAFLGVAEPIFGRIPARGIVAGGTVINHPAAILEVEPEIIFTVSDGPATTGPDIRKLIRRCLVGLEINRPSYADPFALGVNAIVADNAAHLGLVLGPEIPLAALDGPGGVFVRLFRNDEPMGTGSSQTVMDHPVKALEWLAATLGNRNIPLKGGMVVATGAMARPVTLRPGQSLRADFGPGGTVMVERRAANE